MTDFSFETMTKAEFEHHLPEFFASGNGKVSTDPRLQIFLANNPDCAALVKDLETIAEYASSLFDPVDDPSDEVWAGIEAKLRDVAASAPNPAQASKAGTHAESGALSRNGEPNQLVTGGSLDDLE